MHIQPLGEDALLLVFGEQLDAATNAHVHACTRWLKAHRPAWLLDVIPAYASLALVLDTTQFARDCIPTEAARLWLLAQPLPTADTAHTSTGRLHVIEVVYGGEYGPDLSNVAAHAGISTDEVITRHCAAHYSVAMLGFAPGFAYLLGMDASLATPRLAVPRTHVAAGSVGIGGAQTGIYPADGAGGWQIIGRTAATLFDLNAQPPSLLQAGDTLRFVAVDALQRPA